MFKKKLSQLNEIIIKQKTLIKNFRYLTVLQLFNILVPLITLPYLLSVLGTEVYGVVIYSQAIISYFVIIVNFGLNTLAVKEVSIARDNLAELNKIVSSVLFIKGILFVFSFFLLTITIIFLPQFKGYETLLYLTMWLCLYEFIFPIWFFQGIENLKQITFLSLLSRVLFVLLIFVFIKTKEDYLLVPIINGLGAIISGIIGLTIVFKIYKVQFKFVSFNEIKLYIKKSISFFISDISINIFAGSNKIIIGSTLGMIEVAYFDLAEKIISIFRMTPLMIVRNTIYPRVAKTKNVSIIKKTTIIMGLYSIIAIVVLNIFTPFIVNIFGGPEMQPSINIIRLYSIIIFTTHISNYYISVGLWSLGYDKMFRNMMLLSSFTFIIFFLFFWWLNIINIYTITLIPIFVDLYLIFHIYYFWKFKVKY